MLVNEKNTVVAKEAPILPGDHLSKAKYTDVIERQLLDGNSEDEKIKLCVSSDIELKKCQVLRDVAFSRDIRPQFECVLKDITKCDEAINKGQVDVVIVEAQNIEKHNLDNLKPIMFEAFDENDKYVVIAEQDISLNALKKASLYEFAFVVHPSESEFLFFFRKFEASDQRSVDAALQFLDKRRAEQVERICPNNIKNNENGELQVVNSKDLSKYSTDKVLVCPNLKTKPLNEFKACNFDVTMPGAVSFLWKFALNKFN